MVDNGEGAAAPPDELSFFISDPAARCGDSRSASRVFRGSVPEPVSRRPRA